VKAAQRRGVKFGRKLKLTAQQITHAWKLIDQGVDRQKVATLFKVDGRPLTGRWHLLKPVHCSIAPQRPSTCANSRELT